MVGKEEIFNYAHSRMRNTIERIFSVFKEKWHRYHIIEHHLHSTWSTCTTRKKLTRSAPNMATRSAYAVRCG
jgi:hypothetical protein